MNKTLVRASLLAIALAPQAPRAEEADALAVTQDLNAQELVQQDAPTTTADSEPLSAETQTEETTGAAADADSTGATVADEIEEIIITGSRLRKEAVQETPLAVSVLNADALDKLQASDIRAVSSNVPNLTVTEIGTSPGIAAISLRGFTTISSDISTEPGVPIYVDGVYQVINAGQLADTFDLQQLEVLRGPQGTLLGKNAAAGAILLTRSRPTGEWGGKAEVEYGRYNLVQVRGLLNFPIIPNVLSGKLFAGHRTRDGWVEDLSLPDTKLSKESKGSVRGALLYTPTENLELYVSADYMQDRSGQMGGRNVSDPGKLSCDVALVCAPHEGMHGVSGATMLADPKRDDNNLTANLNWTLGGAKLTSISGYRNYREVNNVDLDQVAANIIEVVDYATKVQQFSEELRLSSVENGGLDLDGRLSWLIATYVGHSKAKQHLPFVIFGGPSNQAQETLRDSLAVFGHVDYDFTESWTVSFGARRSWDETDHDFSLRQSGLATPALTNSESGKWSNTSFEAGTQYKIDAHKMVYFRYAEGFRGGGFVGLPGTVTDQNSGEVFIANAEFDPETSKSYEIGAKTSWLDSKLQLNVTLFDTQYKNLQRDVVVPGPNNSFIQLTSNAADAEMKGVEFETVYRPISPLSISANVGHIDAKYTQYLSSDGAGGTIDLSDNKLAYTPKYTFGFATDYTLALGDGGWLTFDTATLHGDVSARKKMVTSNTESDASRVPEYHQLDTSVTFDSSRNYALTLYIENVLNKRTTIFGEDVPPLISHEFDNIGRIWGASFKITF